MLIALVYRAEASSASAAIQLQESSEELQWEMPKLGHHARFHQAAQAQATETPVAPAQTSEALAPAPEAPAEPRCHRFKGWRKGGRCCKSNGTKTKGCGRGRRFLRIPGVIVPSSSFSPAFSPFTTPVATLALLTYIIVHIPALLLNSPFFYQYLLTSPEIAQDKCMKIMVDLLANMPPRFWAIVAVPVAVGVACVCRWNNGGKEMWSYAEEWILVKSKEAEAAEVATAPADVEAPAPAVDTKDVPPAYEVLFEADVKEAPAEVKA